MAEYNINIDRVGNDLNEAYDLGYESCMRDYHIKHSNEQQTNADKIRASTDEELAHWMYKHVECRYCPCNPCVSYDDIDEAGNIKCNPCELILLAWLRKEATDG